MPQPIEGIFISPSAQEAMVIYEACDRAGLEKSGKGVLKLLVGFIEGEPVKRPAFSKLADHFEKHPEHAEMLLREGTNLGGLAGRFLLGQIKKHMPKPAPK